MNCEKILEDPNKGISRHRNEISPLNTVLMLLKDSDSRIQQVAMLSLMKVFNDVLPVVPAAWCEAENYPIHVATKEEKEVQVKKEVRKLRNYEESLMVFYTVCDSPRADD